MSVNHAAKPKVVNAAHRDNWHRIDTGYRLNDAMSSERVEQPGDCKVRGEGQVHVFGQHLYGCLYRGGRKMDQYPTLQSSWGTRVRHLVTLEA